MEPKLEPEEEPKLEPEMEPGGELGAWLWAERVGTTERELAGLLGTVRAPCCRRRRLSAAAAVWPCQTLPARMHHCRRSRRMEPRLGKEQLRLEMTQLTLRFRRSLSPSSSGA